MTIINARLKEISVPLLGDTRYGFELPSGEFVLIDLRDDVNEQWRVQHFNRYGEYTGGLYIEPQGGLHSTRQVASS